MTLIYDGCIITLSYFKGENPYEKIISAILICVILLYSFPLVATADEINTYEIETNEIAANATLIEGETMTGAINSKEDVDWYKFEATQDYFEVGFSINDAYLGTEISDGWKITIYPVDSGASIVGDFVVSDVGTFETPTLPYEKGKEYFIKVEADYIHSAPINLTYHIAVVDATASKKWEVEKGGAAVKYATTISDSYTYYGNLINGNDNDYYKYSVTAAGKLKVSFSRPDSDADGQGYKIKVINSAGKEITSKTVDDLKSASFTATVSKGTYYVKIRTYKTVGSKKYYSAWTSYKYAKTK